MRPIPSASGYRSLAVASFTTAFFLGLLLSESAGSSAEDAPETQWTTIGERLGEWSFLTPIPQLQPLLDQDGESLGLRAEDCGACHDAIFQEWRRSTHATALQDLQFLAELAKADSPRWLCLNCHIPVQNQRRYLVRSDSRLEQRKDDIRFLEEVTNPAFDPAMQEESITCATCHVRQDEEGASHVLTPGKTSEAPHPVVARPEDLRSSCLGCHSPGSVRLTPTFFCWFETAEELENGPWSGEASCVDCHMPRDQDGHRQHHWVGGGIPKWYDRYDDLVERGWEPGLEVSDVQITRKDDGSSLGVRVSYANARAGHWLPTADPERFLLFTARLLAAGGEELAEARLRIGQRWDWGDTGTGRPAKRIHDNRLRPREERVWEVELAAPELPAPARLHITALNVRLTEANADHMKNTPLDSVEQYLPDLASQVQNLERHYPFFTWIHREEVELSTGERTRWSLAELVEASRNARNLSRDERLELLREPEDPRR